MPKYAVGIDLGTTNSCAAVFKEGKVEIIPNKLGNRMTPSFVAFTDEVRLIGDAAKGQVAMNPENTVFNVKRLIGQKCNNPEVQKDIEQWSYNVVSSAGDRPMVQVEFKGEKKAFTPEEISSMILMDLKKSAEEYLCGPVESAVITVPAHFNDAQRRATKDAGRIAGFNVLGVLNEPTAAAIAYGFDKRKDGKKNVLVYDLGGGTFDVTILTMDNGVFDVKSTAGDVHLGGEDFDNRVVDYFAEEIQKTHKQDIKSFPKALRRLRTACEEAKRKLMSVSQCVIELDAFIEGINFKAKLSRTKFEELCEDLFEKTLETVEDALFESELSENDIDEVVLVGGSTRIPKIQEMLSEFFDGKQLSKTINPDEAVACGAAIQASTLSGDVSNMIGELTLRDVTPLSLGVEVDGGIMYVIVPRNTTIPARETEIFWTNEDYQTSMATEVYEGERSMAKDNNFLGRFELEGITPALRGDTEVEDTFEIDKDGILTVTSRDISNGVTNNITITNETGRLSDDDIIRMIEEARRYEEEDRIALETAEARQRIEDIKYDLGRALKDRNSLSKVSLAHRQVVEISLNEAKEWLRDNPRATKEQYDAYYEQLKTLFDDYERALANSSSMSSDSSNNSN